MKKIFNHLWLPKVLTDFEVAHLRKLNRVALAFFALHVPVLAILAWANSTRPLLALVLSLLTLSGPALALATFKNPRGISMIHGVAAIFFGGLLVHFGQGPVQIEMHFYFFALIAMLAVFGNPMVVIGATVTVALHHLVLWFLLPRSVFNYGAPLWVVAVHAAFVVLEAIAACYIARSFFDNVIGLEKIVKSRTAALDARNADMRRVLDNVGQGFVTVDAKGVLSAERSRAFDIWFGSEATTIFAAFATRSQSFADRLRVGWDALIEDFLPRELLLDQLPKRLTFDGVVLDVKAMPIAGAATDSFLIVVTDVTADSQREHAESEQHELVSLFDRMLHDRTGTNEYFDEGNRLVESITNPQSTTLTVLKRWIHTLKGNSGIFGLESVATICHELESFIAEEGTFPSLQSLAKLETRWKNVRQSTEKIFGGSAKMIEIDPTEHAALESEAKRVSTSLFQKLHALKLEPTGKRLDLFAEQARRIATRLDKQIDVKIDHNGVRLDPEAWAGFWSAFVHAVRNSVDHGLESDDERIAAGKSRNGVLTLRSITAGERFFIEIQDDGRGVDWERVREKALASGLPANTPRELEAALFYDGLTTATEVTEISGRGIGLGALQFATKNLNGEIRVHSELGSGTIVSMSFPITMMSPTLSQTPKKQAPQRVVAA